MNMEFTRKLAIPMEVKEMYPITPEISETVASRDDKLKRILSGTDERLILIVGPCSADREDSVMDYMHRLKKVSDSVSDKIFIIPRLYTNKPRTSGAGYKGLVHQPDPTGKPDLFKGIIETRKLHMEVVAETGFTAADEMLYPENHKYIDDLLGYVTVGARSVEDQQHRLTASGVSVPVGMKNPTAGDFNVMLNAIKTAQHRHSFIYRGWEAHSMGNPYAHAILRGYTDMHGNHIPNYHRENVSKLLDLYREYDIENPAVIIDANHSNSGKDPFKQPDVIKEVLNYRKEDDNLKSFIKGFMIESYLKDGAQTSDGTEYGKSITDACLGFEKTEALISEIYNQI